MKKIVLFFLLTSPIHANEIFNAAIFVASDINATKKITGYSITKIGPDNLKIVLPPASPIQNGWVLINNKDVNKVSDLTAPLKTALAAIKPDTTLRPMPDPATLLQILIICTPLNQQINPNNFLMGSTVIGTKVVGQELCHFLLLKNVTLSATQLSKATDLITSKMIAIVEPGKTQAQSVEQFLGVQGLV